MVLWMTTVTQASVVQPGPIYHLHTLLAGVLLGDGQIRVHPLDAVYASDDSARFTEVFHPCAVLLQNHVL